MKHGSIKVFRIALAIMALAMITSCSDHTYPDLGEGYRLVSDGECSLAILNAQNDVLVPDHVLNYAFDSTFIIASQRPWNVPDVPGIKELTYTQRRKAFKESSYQQYWIIIKSEMGKNSLDSLSKPARYASVCGPFDRQEYLLKRDELGVPKELILKE